MKRDIAHFERGRQLAAPAGEPAELACEAVGGRRRRRRVALRALARVVGRVGEKRAAVVEVGAKHGQLEQPALVRDRRVGTGACLGLDRPEHRHVQVGGEREQRGGDERRRPAPVSSQQRVEGEGGEGGEGEAGDRQQPLGDACEAKRREGAPERPVERQVRPQREEAGQRRREPQQPREAALPPPGGDDSGERQQRHQPTEEDVLLDARSDVARDEVRQLGRVTLDGGERPASGGDRAAHHRQVHAEPCRSRQTGREGSARPQRARQPCPRVAEEERDRPERQMELAGERDRHERGQCPAEPPALERQEHRGQQERDEPEQMPRALPDAIRREREHEPAGERGAARQAECPQPPAREPAGGHHREEHEQVVGPRAAEEPFERPVRKTEQPALHVRRRLGLGPERVRIGPWCPDALELMPDEPEGPAQLQVVAGGRLAVPRCGPCEVVVVDVPCRGPRCEQRRSGVDR